MPGLEDLYREIILDHYRSPRNRGELDTPPAHRSEGFNPLCGDEIVVYVDVEDGVISDIRIGGQGCSISQASASMMTGAVKGKSFHEVEALTRAFKSMMSIVDGDSNDTVSDNTVADNTDSNDTDSNDTDPPVEVDLGDLEALRGVVKFPVRIKCATLSWNTLAEAIAEVGDD